MRKYYYYVYESQKAFGCNICYSDSGEFDLSMCYDCLSVLKGQPFVIKFWHEISSSQYEKMSKYFENQKK